MNGVMKYLIGGIIGLSIGYTASNLPDFYKNRDNRLEKEFQEAQTTIKATVLKENCVDDFFLGTQYSLTLKTDDGRILDLHVRDYVPSLSENKDGKRAIPSSSLDYQIEPGSKIIFPENNVIEPNFVFGLLRDTRDTDFTTGTTEGVKRVDRIRVVER
jgi:hypothetical protein